MKKDVHTHFNDFNQEILRIIILCSLLLLDVSVVLKAALDDDDDGSGGDGDDDVGDDDDDANNDPSLMETFQYLEILILHVGHSRKKSLSKMPRRLKMKLSQLPLHKYLH